MIVETVCVSRALRRPPQTVSMNIRSVRWKTCAIREIEVRCILEQAHSSDYKHVRAEKQRRLVRKVAHALQSGKTFEAAAILGKPFQDAGLYLTSEISTFHKDDSG